MAEKDWEPFYKELVSKVLAYRNDRSNLLAKLKEILDKSAENEYKEKENKQKRKSNKSDAGVIYGSNYPTLGKDSNGNSNIKLDDSRIKDIDPFTFISCLNNGKKEIKSHGIAAQDVFDMNNHYPFDFDYGIPIIPGQVKCFVWYEENGDQENYKNRIEYCWDLFECVNNYVMNPALYKDQFASLLLKFNDMTSKRIGSASIMFFLISPDNFISLDEPTKKFLRDPENDFSQALIGKLNGFSGNSYEFNLDYYLDFCNMLKAELTSFDEEMDFKKLVYYSYGEVNNDSGNWNKKAPRERISSFFKSDRFKGAYDDLDVRQSGGNCTFGTRNVDDRYWLTPRKELFDETWYVVLHDDVKHIIYLFKVPAGSIDSNIVHNHKTYEEKKSMRIDYKDMDFPDHECDNQVKLVDYLKETIPYSTNDIKRQQEKTHSDIIGTNKIYYGIPGCGKSHLIDEQLNGKNIKRVVFHPDYTYSDFVGQILPVVVNDKIKYEFVPGPFTQILGEAFKHKDTEYYLIIEELNRGNAPAIFGDIFQLLDRDETGNSRYKIVNNDVRECIKKEQKIDLKEIFIPSNLSIYATMNTADQNVFTLDTAFQRRWEMEYVPDDINSCLLASVNIGGNDANMTWKEFHDSVNELISSSRSSVVTDDKRLGAYFCSENELKDLQLFANKVLKYLYDDAFKLRRNEIFVNDIKNFDSLMAKIPKGENPEFDFSTIIKFPNKD